MNTRKLSVGSVLVSLMVACTLPVGANDLLRGKVQKDNTPQITRIKRPLMPGVDVTHGAEAGVLKATVNKKDAALQAAVEEDDFVLPFETREPNMDMSGLPNNKPLRSKTDDNSLIIEWEEWHHRVCAAIFERWKKLGIIPGKAHTRIKFTNDRRVVVTVTDVELAPDVFSHLPPLYRMYSGEELRRRFQNAVEMSVMPLNGMELLAFPERSKRTQVVINPYFSGTEESGYTYLRGDRERVSLP
jgi:hypothetical protein